MRTKMSLAMFFVVAVIMSNELSAGSIGIDEKPVVDDPPTQIARDSRG